MKYEGPSIVSTHQVGATVYIIENDVPVEVTVQYTETEKTGDGAVATYYFMQGYNKRFAESEVYETVGDMKTAFDDLADAL